MYSSIYLHFEYIYILCAMLYSQHHSYVSEASLSPLGACLSQG